MTRRTLPSSLCTVLWLTRAAARRCEFARWKKSALLYGGRPHFTCNTPVDVVGPKNVTLSAALQETTHLAGDLLFWTVCTEDFYGQLEEWCVSRPRRVVGRARDAAVEDENTLEEAQAPCPPPRRSP